MVQVSAEKCIKYCGTYFTHFYCSILSPTIILSSKTHTVELTLHVLLDNNDIIVKFANEKSAKTEIAFKRSKWIARIRGKYTLINENDLCEYTLNGVYSVYCNNDNIPYVLFVRLGE